MRSNVIIITLGVMVILVGVVFALFNPFGFDEIIDKVTPGESGRYVSFHANINRPTLGEPYIVNVGVASDPVPQPFSVFSNLDSKVVVSIQGNGKNVVLESTYWASSATGGSTQMTTPSTYLPFGSYQVKYELFNKGGEVCFPSCTWASADVVMRNLAIGENTVIIS